MRIIDADELERRIREAEKIFYDIEDVGIAIDCIDATKTISEWHYPSKGEYPISGADVWDGYRVLNYLIDLKRWVYDDDFEVSEPRCWCYLPEPPKEEA